MGPVLSALSLALIIIEMYFFLIIKKMNKKISLILYNVVIFNKSKTLENCKTHFSRDYY